MLFTVSVHLSVNAVNASLRSRVRENFKHGSVRGVTANEINLCRRLNNEP